MYRAWSIVCLILETRRDAGNTNSLYILDFKISNFMFCWPCIPV